MGLHSNGLGNQSLAIGRGAFPATAGGVDKLLPPTRARSWKVGEALGHMHLLGGRKHVAVNKGEPFGKRM